MLFCLSIHTSVRVYISTNRLFRVTLLFFYTLIIYLYFFIFRSLYQNVIFIIYIISLGTSCMFFPLLHLQMLLCIYVSVYVK